MDIDLEKYRETLGDPALFFVHERPGGLPAICRHSTGEPEYVILPDGTLCPWIAVLIWNGGKGLTMQAEPARFKFDVTAN